MVDPALGFDFVDLTVGSRAPPAQQVRPLGKQSLAPTRASPLGGVKAPAGRQQQQQPVPAGRRPGLSPSWGARQAVAVKPAAGARPLLVPSRTAIGGSGLGSGLGSSGEQTQTDPEVLPVRRSLPAAAVIGAATRQVGSSVPSGPTLRGGAGSGPGAGAAAAVGGSNSGKRKAPPASPLKVMPSTLLGGRQDVDPYDYPGAGRDNAATGGALTDKTNNSRRAQSAAAAAEPPSKAVGCVGRETQEDNEPLVKRLRSHHGQYSGGDAAREGVVVAARRVSGAGPSPLLHSSGRHYQRVLLSSGEEEGASPRPQAAGGRGRGRAEADRRPVRKRRRPAR